MFIYISSSSWRISYFLIFVFFLLQQSFSLNRDYNADIDPNGQFPDLCTYSSDTSTISSTSLCLLHSLEWRNDPNNARLPSAYDIKSLSENYFYDAGIESRLLTYIPTLSRKCSVSTCQHEAIYMGYIDSLCKSYTRHLKSHLNYCLKHPECLCLWPECNAQAAEISDVAYILFKELFLSTKLSELITHLTQKI